MYPTPAPPDQLSGARAGRFLFDWARADVFAQLTVESFEYPRSDAPDNLVFLGPASRAGSIAAPLPGWWDDVESAARVVHVSQGTLSPPSTSTS